MNLAKGEIIDVDLGKPPKEIKGHEQGLVRPCVVVKAFSILDLAIVVPVTSKQPKYPIFTIVKLPKGSGGLTSDSYVLCHQIRAISFKRIIKKRTRLDDKDILKIHSVLIDTLEI
ncbi:mRNA interferase MazF [Thermoflavifilum aggregans]|uniref:mRNA interferase MazF n=1 Tax=Thermoflavifilum aggregans TaxID=454188 RepID=A0A2M9CSB8_9BACT|nr:type II toxin-antitoxin system PemK/MazF family toxin [Thermoflavifilum aggregans]PJJ74797.1 mRNA interferase MazF [Thermoflavifilum aggregans]